MRIFGPLGNPRWRQIVPRGIVLSLPLPVIYLAWALLGGFPVAGSIEASILIYLVILVVTLLAARRMVRLDDGGEADLARIRPRAAGTEHQPVPVWQLVIAGGLAVVVAVTFWALVFPHFLEMAVTAAVLFELTRRALLARRRPKVTSPSRAPGNSDG